MRYTIREYKKSDLKEYAKLSYKLARIESKWLGLKKEVVTLKNIESEARKSKDKIFVCEYDGNLVGFVSFKIKKRGTEFKIKQYVWVGRIYVLPEHRRNNVGTGLVKAVEKYAKNKDIKEINLYLQEKNLSVIKFYNSLGYKTTERCLTRRIK